MKQKLIFILLFIISSTSSQAQLDMAITTRLKDTVDFLLQKNNYKGLSVAVRVRNKGDWNYAAGVSAPSQPLQTQMGIGIGSNTKTFVAAAILQLVANGLLSLDDSVGKWLPAMNNVKASIKIRQLLNHTSGIYNYTNNQAFGDSLFAKPGYIWTKLELVNKFTKTKVFDPGASWHYSNTNYLVAALIAEAASSRPIHELIRDSILIPFGLQYTFFPPQEQITIPLAQFWSNQGSGFLQNFNMPPSLYSMADAAGAMVSDAADNCLFWELLGQGQIVRKDLMIKEMMKWISAPSIRYGLGLMRTYVNGNYVFSHGGSIVGQLNENLLDTLNGFSITVLSNQDSLSPNRVVIGLYRILLSSGFYTGVSEQDSEQRIECFPNPAKVYLTLNCRPGTTLKFVSMAGTVMKEVMIEDNTKLYVGDLHPGVYMLYSNYKGQVKVGKLIKQ